MSETRQTALFAALICLLVCAMGTLMGVFQILDQQRTDNQTITTLRAQLTETQKDEQFAEAEVAKLAQERDDAWRQVDQLAFEAAKRARAQQMSL